MPISELTIYQDNKVGDSNLMPVHSPLVFLIDATYTITDPYFIYCKLYEGETLLNTFKCIPYKDITTTQRRFMFKADSILRGYMETFEDFEQTNDTLEFVDNITKEFTLVFNDPDGDAADVTLDIVAIHGASQFGEYPNKSSIYNNESETILAASGKTCYVYFFNDNVNNDLSTGESYYILFIISDSVGFLSNSEITLNSIIEYTDTNGEAKFWAQNGSYSYIVEKYGYVSNSGNVVINDANVTIEIELVEDDLYNVNFTVTDGVDPIENAEITIEEESPIYTDSFGQVTIQLYSKTYNYSIDAGYIYNIYSDSFILNYIDLNVNPILTAASTYEALFIVKDLEDNPVLGAVVTVIGIKIKNTDINGEATIDYLYADTYSYSVSKDGNTVNGSFVITNSNIQIDIILGIIT